jgi:hypothetical protein
MRPSFTLGIEEEYQTIDPETREFARTSRPRCFKGKLRSKSALCRDAPGGHRGRHPHLQQHSGCPGRPLRPPPQHDSSPKNTACPRRRRDPSFADWRPEIYPDPATPRSSKTSSSSPVPTSSRPPRPRRHRRPRSRHPHHEPAPPPAHLALPPTPLLARHGNRLRATAPRFETSPHQPPDSFASYPSSKTTSTSSKPTHRQRKIWWTSAHPLRHRRSPHLRHPLALTRPSPSLLHPGHRLQAWRHSCNIDYRQYPALS